jgi:hypothetical protein
MASSVPQRAFQVSLSGLICFRQFAMGLACRKRVVKFCGLESWSLRWEGFKPAMHVILYGGMVGQLVISGAPPEIGLGV